MEANAVNSATQTSDFESDDEPYASPRAMVDTSAPFHSVEEAVIRFGGRGFWIPGSILGVDADADADAATSAHLQETETSDVQKLEERTVEMLKELQLKEKETNDILQELELTKQLVEDLKLKLSNVSPETVEDLKKEHVDVCISSVTGMMMSEIKKTKLSLFQNTNELAEIRASVETLSKKIDKENPTFPQENVARLSVNPLVLSKELRELNNEAEQFMKTAEAAKAEVQKAMSEIDHTKAGLKKLEEAARTLSSHNERVANKPVRISLSVEEYCTLTDKAKKADGFFKKIEGFPRRESRPRTRPTTSIGDILSMKQAVKEGDGGATRERVSLNQMLIQHRREGSPQRRIETNDGSETRLFPKRKGLGLVHISFPLSKHGKNKIQALNH